MYIQEAHPSDLWQLPSNVKEDVVFSSPKTDSERVSLATACIRKLGIDMPALVDGIGDSTEQNYTGWPDRLYVIDSAGSIAYKSRPGPFGFAPAEMEKALARILNQPNSDQMQRPPAL